MFSFDGVKKISVRDGDPVILQTRITDVTIDDVIEWTFGPQHTSAVKTDREHGRIIYNEHDVRFRDRLHLNIQTGDLTISNTKPEVFGLYQIKIIKSTYTIQKSFSVTVSGEYFKSFKRKVSFRFVLCESGYIVLMFLVFVIDQTHILINYFFCFSLSLQLIQVLNQGYVVLALVWWFGL